MTEVRFVKLVNAVRDWVDEQPQVFKPYPLKRIPVALVADKDSLDGHVKFTVSLRDMGAGYVLAEMNSVQFYLDYKQITPYNNGFSFTLHSPGPVDTDYTVTVPEITASILIWMTSFKDVMEAATGIAWTIVGGVNEQEEGSGVFEFTFKPTNSGDYNYTVRDCTFKRNASHLIPFPPVGQRISSLTGYSLFRSTNTIRFVSSNLIEDITLTGYTNLPGNRFSILVSDTQNMRKREVSKILPAPSLFQINPLSPTSNITISAIDDGGNPLVLTSLKSGTVFKGSPNYLIVNMTLLR